MEKYNEYKLKEIQEELKRRKDKASEILEQWKKVERVTKKDGSDFKNLKQNFINCNINGDMHPKLYVGHSLEYGWGCIDIWEDERTAPKEIKKERFHSCYGYYNWYVFNPEEIERALKKHIKKLEKHINELEEDIKESENAFIKVNEKMEEIKAILQQYNKSDLAYRLNDYIKKEYYF